MTVLWLSASGVDGGFHMPYVGIHFYRGTITWELRRDGGTLASRTCSAAAVREKLPRMVPGISQLIA